MMEEILILFLSKIVSNMLDDLSRYYPAIIDTIVARPYQDIKLYKKRHKFLLVLQIPGDAGDNAVAVTDLLLQLTPAYSSLSGVEQRRARH